MIYDELEWVHSLRVMWDQVEQILGEQYAVDG